MFRAPARKLVARASPMTMSGTDRTSVVELKAYHDPNAPVQRAASARAGWYPAARSPRARAPSPRPAASPVIPRERPQLADAAGKTGSPLTAARSRSLGPASFRRPGPDSPRVAPRSPDRGTPPGLGRSAPTPRPGRWNTPAPQPRPGRPAAGADGRPP